MIVASYWVVVVIGSFEEISGGHSYESGMSNNTTNGIATNNKSFQSFQTQSPYYSSF